jgi:hypothetical protein
LSINAYIIKGLMKGRYPLVIFVQNVNIRHD